MERYVRLRAFLENHPLEEIVRNIPPNNPWLEEPDLEQVRDEVRRTYTASDDLIAGVPLEAVAKQQRLPLARVRNWRYKDIIPEILLAHEITFSPAENRQRKPFAYILGMHSQWTYADKRNKILFRKIIPPGDKRKRALQNLEALLGKNVNKNRQGIEVRCAKFIKVLNYCLTETFREYVSSDDERRFYVQGFIDASKVAWRMNRGKGSYRFTVSDPEVFDKIAEAFFELGMYPCLSFADSRISLETPYDLRTMVQLGLADGEGKKYVETLDFTSLKYSHEISHYFDARRYTRQQLQLGKVVEVTDLAKNFGVTKITAARWVTDLLGLDVPAGWPHAVDRYKAIVQYLNLPDVQEAEEPMVRNGKLFFPVGEHLYWMSPKILAQYHMAMGFSPSHEWTKDDGIHLWLELQMNLTQHKERDLTMKIEGLEIKMIKLQEGDAYRCDQKKDSVGVSGPVGLWSGWDVGKLI